jgi:hypothetical protein
MKLQNKSQRILLCAWGPTKSSIPGRDDGNQMQDTDDGESQAHQNFQPNHPYVWRVEPRVTIPTVDLRGLSHCFPGCQKSKANGEPKGHRRNEQIILRHEQRDEIWWHEQHDWKRWTKPLQSKDTIVCEKKPPGSP